MVIFHNYMTHAEAYAEGLNCPGEKYSRMVRGICTCLFEGSDPPSQCMLAPLAMILAKCYVLEYDHVL